MKKCGLLALLFVFLLVAMPAVATDLVSADAWLIPGVSETEFSIGGELTVNCAGETLADLSVCPYQNIEVTNDIIVLAPSGLSYVRIITDTISINNEILLFREALFNTAFG